MGHFCVLEKVPEGNAGGADGFRCQDSAKHRSQKTSQACTIFCAQDQIGKKLSDHIAKKKRGVGG
eukprot:COSAG04_NODE_5497_length_1595_cov_1.169673_2_plen_64_part_01